MADFSADDLGSFADLAAVDKVNAMSSDAWNAYASNAMSGTGINWGDLASKYGSKVAALIGAGLGASGLLGSNNPQKSGYQGKIPLLTATRQQLPVFGNSYQPTPTIPTAPSNRWAQTVNDIYQQELGRQADESGMANYTSLLNQGMTGEQIREQLRSSSEGQQRASAGVNLQPQSEGISQSPQSASVVPPSAGIAQETTAPRRPGSMGRRYFTDMVYAPKSGIAAVAPAAPVVETPVAPVAPAPTVPVDNGGMVSAAHGGMMGYAQGGIAALYLGGQTDGMADKIPANIDEKQPAKLSHGEFVVPADIVSALGSGNSSAGAKVLYDMMDRIRKHAHGTTKQIKPANLKKTLPA